MTTAKASSFGPHGNFGPFFFFLQVPWLLWINHVPKMKRTEFLDLKFFYNFYLLYFSVGRIAMIGSLSEKEVQS
jgi:hypothetical protein